MSTQAPPRLKASGALLATLLTATTLHANGTYETTTEGLAGTGGLVPVLTGSGPAVSPSPDNAVKVTNALPGAPATMIVGFDEYGEAFRGGILGPTPNILVAGIPVDAQGEIEIPFAIPDGVPDGTQTWNQFWIVDPAGVAGLSATNTLLVTISDQFDFFPSYEDPYPDDFHPLYSLGGSTASALRTDELTTWFNNGPGANGSLYTKDDTYVGSGATAIQDPSGLFGDPMGSFTPKVGTSGDVDGDGSADALYIGLDGDRLGIRSIANPSSLGDGLGNVRFQAPGIGPTGVIGFSGDAGDVDGDGLAEVVVTETYPNPFGGWVTAMVVYKLQSGVFQRVHEWTSLGDFGRVALAQLDSDSALEIVLAVEDADPDAFFVRVFDDLTSGSLETLGLGSVYPFPGPSGSVLTSMEIVPGQYDDDIQHEIAFVAQQINGTVFGDVDPLAADVSMRVTTANPTLDESGQVVDLNLPTSAAASINLFNNGPSRRWDRHNAGSVKRFVAADLVTEGVERIYWLHETKLDPGFVVVVEPGPQQYNWQVDSFPAWELDLQHINPLTDVAPTEVFPLTPNNFTAVPLPGLPGPPSGLFNVKGHSNPLHDLAVVDVDGRGEDQIAMSFAGGSFRVEINDFVAFPEGLQIPPQLMLASRHATATGYIDVQKLPSADPFAVTHQPTPVLPLHKAPILAAGDFHGENLGLRFLGSRQEILDPIPLVLMATPPYQVEANQWTNAVASSYLKGTDSTHSYQVSTSKSVSASAGLSLEDPFGLFQTELKTTVTSAVEQSTGTSTEVAFEVEYAGGSEADMIVFQATLATIYEYEVVTSPDGSMLGELFSINIPVDTTVYAFEIEDYNALMPESERVPDDIFTHTIGSVASYAGEDALKDELALAGYESWFGGEVTPPYTAGTASSTSLTLSSAQTQGETISYGVDVSADFVVGGAAFGTSISLSSDSMYEVTVGESTQFKGTIGSVPDQATFFDWGYKTGLVLYNRPATGSFPPVQVVDFWTETSGDLY